MIIINKIFIIDVRKVNLNDNIIKFNKLYIDYQFLKNN